MSDAEAQSVVQADFYTAIGRVAAAWAQFEVFINHTIWELANVEQFAGACITAQIAAPMSRFRALIALVQYRGGGQDLIAPLNKLSHKADGVARERNRLIHDPSTVDALGTFHQLRITADRKLDFSFVPVSLKEIKALEIKIVVLSRECYATFQSTLDALPAYEREQFARSGGINPRPPDPNA